MAKRCLLAECAYCRAEELYNVEFTLEQAEEARHGKVTMYLRHGCECDECREAIRAYWNRRYYRRRANNAAKETSRP